MVAIELLATVATKATCHTPSALAANADAMTLTERDASVIARNARSSSAIQRNYAK